MRNQPTRLAHRLLLLVLLAFLGSAASGCAPEVGSDAWCKKLKDTPKGDWSTNDASAYATNCLLK